MPESGEAVWVYAVCREEESRQPDTVTGVAGEALRTVTNAGLAALVGTVPLDRFGEEALRRDLEDLDRVAEIARAHHRVAAAAAQMAPTIPTRLATVYRSDERVAEVLGARAAEFRTVLTRITGRQEWGVKAYARGSPDAAQSPGPPGEHPAPAGRGSGTAYLSRRRAQLSAAEQARRRIMEAALAVHSGLTAVAVLARRHQTQDPQLSGTNAWMVLNGAYLVDEEQTKAFAATVERLGGEHAEVRLELTGPWPPYSFAAPDDAAPDITAAAS